MEMCLVLGNKGLWSCSFHQASESGDGPVLVELGARSISAF